MLKAITRLSVPAASTARTSAVKTPLSFHGIWESRRCKRYDAFEAHLDQDALQEARSWYHKFEPEQLPKGTVTYARSSGPGGQHVNKTETKATSVFPVHQILAILPRMLHPSIRSSQYYTASSDSLTFQAQEFRSRTANADENRKKLMSEIARIYSKVVPAETGDDKREKYKRVEQKFHDTRVKQKKLNSNKKQSRKGPPV